MRNVTKDNITEVFTGYIGEDTRTRVVREVAGTALAQRICTPSCGRREPHPRLNGATGLEFLEHGRAGISPIRSVNEFVLLSDVLGTVVAGRHGQLAARKATSSSSVLGPFHVSGPPPLGDRRRHEAPVSRASWCAGSKAPCMRRGRHPGRRRRDRHLADRAQRACIPARIPKSRTRAFLPRADDQRTGATGRYAFTTCQAGRATTVPDGRPGGPDSSDACRAAPVAALPPAFHRQGGGLPRSLVTEVFASRRPLSRPRRRLRRARRPGDELTSRMPAGQLPGWVCSVRSGRWLIFACQIRSDARSGISFSPAQSLPESRTERRRSHGNGSANVQMHGPPRR